jgi:hypothetical protein
LQVESWGGWVSRVVLGVLWLNGLFGLFNNGHNTAATSILVTGLMVAIVVEKWVRPFRRWSQRRAQSWPMTQAHVESVSVPRAEEEHRSYCSREIAYSYSVNGQYYSGFHLRSFDREEEAWAFADALKGKTVLVHYSPGNHEVSVLTDSALRAAISDPSVLREQRWYRFFLPG